MEKYGMRDAKYYEFRMIGNTDYESRYSDIKKSIGYFKKAMIRSLIVA